MLVIIAGSVQVGSALASVALEPLVENERLAAPNKASHPPNLQRKECRKMLPMRTSFGLRRAENSLARMSPLTDVLVLVFVRFLGWSPRANGRAPHVRVVLIISYCPSHHRATVRIGIVS